MRIACAVALAGMALVWVTPAPALAATFNVVNADNAGLGSLRQAILDANDNDNAETDVIEFDIDPLGTIMLASELPGITEALTIDGTTQPGYSDSPLIVLDGSGAGPLAAGLHITASGVTVRGLAVTGFEGTGIFVQSDGDAVNDVAIEDNLVYGNLGYGVAIEEATGTVVRANVIGIDAAGGVDGNTFSGIRTLNVSGTEIGGPLEGDGNVISGNGGDGIEIGCDGAPDAGTTVTRNLIGVSAVGDNPIPNGNDGVFTNCLAAVIGGPFEGDEWMRGESEEKRRRCNDENRDLPLTR